MFGLVHCNASTIARQTTDSKLFFVRILVKNWLWPIITFFGVTGNILAIIVLTKRRMIMSSTNNYLVALALVDIAYLLLTLILNTTRNPCFHDTTIAAVLSVICRPIADFASNTSVWLTVTFTVERWVAITYPLQSRTWCTVHRARKIIFSVMLAALICTSPSAFEVKLVRDTEVKNSTRLRAEHTALGNSILYHQIYFPFVTFAIIWIPLLFLVIFNTILILYVHRSKQDDHKNKEGIQLRRHNRGNQGEQRKTTIMLIAVVIVFTFCQIPQAISLTIQSFFHTLAETSNVLIFNNFANCLVAINASMNFLLYCCFSDRFRSTFRSSFSFLHKYCTICLEPNWKLTTDNNKYSISVDNMSSNFAYNQSNYSLHGQPVNTRISNISNDLSQKHLRKTFSNASQRQSQISNIDRSSWTSILSKFKLNRNTKSDLKQTLVSEMCPNSPTTSIMKSASSYMRQSPTSNNYSSFKPSQRETKPFRSSTVCFTTKEINPSSSSSLLHRSMNKTCSNEKMKKITNIKTNQLNDTPTTLRPIFHSHRSLDDKNTEQIWIKRRLSNDAIQKLFNPQQFFLWKEIVDVTV
ncbi:unnamed protein product [Adineta steineri]|uniref:G-protein coupled receptors family 1 profile domain-containing protein n=1 Tax=Adineta steineri TaxID=433720 RepID=A0A813U7J9_9BILA|nr:unnamed protein product [Adineta steineri]CAF1236910.1 unnamed protein product [Adineta steineri]